MNSDCCDRASELEELLRELYRSLDPITSKRITENNIIIIVNTLVDDFIKLQDEFENLTFATEGLNAEIEELELQLEELAERNEQ